MKYAAPFILGALGGTAVVLGIWWYASRSLDRQLEAGGSQLSGGIAEGRAVLEARLRQGEIDLQRRIREEVPAAVARAGIDPATADRVRRLLESADRAGLLSGLGAGAAYAR